MKRFACCLLCFFMPLFIVGCSTPQGVQDTAIVLGAGLDLIPQDEIVDGNDLLLTVELVKFRGGSEQGGLESVVLSAADKTVLGASKKISRLVNQTLFWGHAQALFWGKELAVEGINKHLEFFYRNSEISPLISMVYVDGNANEAMKKSMGMEIFTSLSVAQNMKLQKQTSKALLGISSLHMFVEKNLIPGAGVLLNTIKALEPESSEENLAEEKTDQEKNPTEIESITFSDMAVIGNDGRFKGLVTDDEYAGTIFWLGQSKGSYVTVYMEDHSRISLEVNQWKIKPKWHEDDPDEKYLELDCEAVAVVRDQEKPIDFSIAENYKEVEELAKDRFIELLELAWHRAVEIGEDYLLIGDTIRKQDYAFWDANKENWQDVFPEIPVVVNLDMKLHVMGNAYDTFFKEERGVYDYQQDYYEE